MSGITLRSAVSRFFKDSRTAATSHTPYKFLSTAEKDQRLRKQHCSIRLLKQQVQRLEAKFEQLIEREGVSLGEDDAGDISTIFDEVHSSSVTTFPHDSPQRIFWDQQRKYNSLKEKRQMRWHPLVIRFALNLKYISTSAYHAVQQSGVINLPSQ